MFYTMAAFWNDETDDNRILDTRDAQCRKMVGMHDAARPFVAMYKMYGGYRSNTRFVTIGRYPTRKGAKAAILRQSAR